MVPATTTTMGPRHIFQVVLPVIFFIIVFFIVFVAITISSHLNMPTVRLAVVVSKDGVTPMVRVVNDEVVAIFCHIVVTLIIIDEVCIIK